MNLIEKLEAYRLEKGLTQEKMARLIDVPLNTYARWIKNPAKKLSTLAIRRIESLEFIK